MGGPIGSRPEKASRPDETDDVHWAGLPGTSEGDSGVVGPSSELPRIGIQSQKRSAEGRKIRGKDPRREAMYLPAGLTLTSSDASSSSTPPPPSSSSVSESTPPPPPSSSSSASSSVSESSIAHETTYSTSRLGSINAAMEAFKGTNREIQTPIVYLKIAAGGGSGDVDVRCLGKSTLLTDIESGSVQGELPLDRTDERGNKYVYDMFAVASKLSEANLSHLEKYTLRPFYEELLSKRDDLIKSEIKTVQKNETSIFRRGLNRLSNKSIKTAAAAKVDAVLNSLQPPQASGGTAKIDATYEFTLSKMNGPEYKRTIIDFAFSDPVSGTIFVGDGASHDDPEIIPHIDFMRSTINEISEQFKKNHFKNKEEANKYIEMKLEELAGIINDDLSTRFHENYGKAPVFIFGQTVEEEGQKYLIVHQTSDCCQLILRADGSYEKLTAFYLDGGTTEVGLGGLEQNTHNDHTGNPTKICRGGFRGFIPINEGDEVIMLSDGIGEFLTTEEFVAICREYPPDERIEACKRAIIDHSEKNGSESENDYHSTTRLRFSEDPTDKNARSLPDNKIKNKYFCKIHNPNSASYFDDISMASLKFGEISLATRSSVPPLSSSFASISAAPSSSSLEDIEELQKIHQQIDDQLAKPEPKSILRKPGSSSVRKKRVEISAGEHPERKSRPKIRRLSESDGPLEFAKRLEGYYQKLETGGKTIDNLEKLLLEDTELEPDEVKLLQKAVREIKLLMTNSSLTLYRAIKDYPFLNSPSTSAASSSGAAPPPSSSSGAPPPK